MSKMSHFVFTLIKQAFCMLLECGRLLQTTYSRSVFWITVRNKKNLIFPKFETSRQIFSWEKYTQNIFTIRIKFEACSCYYNQMKILEFLIPLWQRLTQQLEMVHCQILIYVAGLILYLMLLLLTVRLYPLISRIRK